MKAIAVLAACVQVVVRVCIDGFPDPRVGAILWAVCSIAIAASVMSNKNLNGTPVLAVGLILNAIVVLANGGMPVLLAGGETALVSGFYVPADSTGILVWMGDVIPDPSGQWLMSLGDLLIIVGASVVLTSGSVGTVSSA
jgi:hypothetical protein